MWTPLWSPTGVFLVYGGPLNIPPASVCALGSFDVLDAMQMKTWPHAPGPSDGTSSYCAYRLILTPTAPFVTAWQDPSHANDPWPLLPWYVLFLFPGRIALYLECIRSAMRQAPTREPTLTIRPACYRTFFRQSGFLQPATRMPAAGLSRRGHDFCA